MAKKQISNYKFYPGVIPPAYGQYPQTVAFLQDIKAMVQSDISAYITNQIDTTGSDIYSAFYNYTYSASRRAKCERDVGYIIDAISYDLAYGGNSAVYQIVSRYYIQGQLQIVQKAVEVATWTHVKSLLSTTAGPAIEAAGLSIVMESIDTLINVINNGLGALPAPVAPDTQKGELLPNAVALLTANKRYIQEETIAYIQYNINNNISPYVYFTYNPTKCRRDVSYVIEGYISDLAHGGNRQTVFNAGKYWENGVAQVDGDRQPEIYAHTFIRDLVENYIWANVAYPSKQIVVDQVIDNVNVPEEFANTRMKELTNIVLDVIEKGDDLLPTVISNRGYVKLPGYFKLKDFLLITNTTRNQIMFNFADSDSAAEVTYSEDYDSEFPGALYGVDKITTITFDVDTSGMMVTDNIQIFVEGKEQAVRMNDAGRDAMERMKVGIPQSMLDADFEYGLQPTKWQAISMMRNYPSIYEIPGSDIAVTNVTTDASTGTGGTGASLITVTTQNSHGLTAGDPITVKALANTVSGFSRAEGSFLISNVTSLTSFTYYAKSKVGTSNGQILASTYTQLRRGGYYTGAAIGNPAFSVYNSGSSGTVTTSLITPAGRDVIGFTGSPPPIGSPLSGTGLTSGAQVTASTGSGGIVASTQLVNKGNIGDTTITVLDTTGISAGLVFDRGDGVASVVTDVSGNVVSLGSPLTSVILGRVQNYTGLTASETTSVAGDGAVITVARSDTTYSTTVTTPGSGYVNGDTITIYGTSLDGAFGTNDAVITIDSATPINNVASLDNATLVGGSGYYTTTGVATTAATGSGLTLDVTADESGGLATPGTVTAVAINQPGSGYTVGEVITITGGDGLATIQVLTVAPGGVIQSVSTVGTPITAPTKNFISAFTISESTTAQIADGNTGITYSAIATIQIAFPSAHGFVPGNTITVSISSAGTGAQLAAGPFFVEQVPDANTIRYTARAAGTIDNTLAGLVYGRPDSFFVHRPFDGGVQLGTASPSHGATAIRMSKKYIRYQSGKGVMYNTGALFAPSYDIRSLTSTGTAVGSVITLVTDDTDHGCQVGGVIQINGVQTSGYNGTYTVTDVTNERQLSIIANRILGATTAVLGSPCQMSIRNWHGSTIRAGIFDDQNGMFWQYDGQRMAVVRRSSTNQLAGTIAIAANSNLVTGNNTRFSQQLAAGDRVVIRGMSHVVSQVVSDTTMYVTPDFRGVNNVTEAKIVKTIDLVVPQENWNLDPLNGSGPSGYNIDVTRMQMIGIQHTWYGAGFIDFMLRGPDGNYTWAHRFRNSNVNTEAYMRTGNQPVRYEVINEGAKGVLADSMTSSQTTMTLKDAYWFPNAGTVLVDSELIRYTGNTGTTLTGCTRAANLTQFVAGSQRNFSGSPAGTHSNGAGVILVSNTITPNISHWGSAFMIDGQFDSDRGYIFNYASTAVSAAVDKSTAFLIRLAPSVSNAQVGDLGEKELLNRAQLLLSSISCISDSVSGGGAIVVEGVLNPQNYPTDPTKITWTGLSSSAAGGQPSFAQIASGGSVTWSGNATTQTATVQGAFTTTLTAKAFNAVTNSLTAVAFNAVQYTITAWSFSVFTSTTYRSALSNARTDFLVTTADYDALSTSMFAGDPLQNGSYLFGGQTLSSVTRNYITLAGVSYTRVVMSGVASNTSPQANNNGDQNQTITVTSSIATRFNTAVSNARTDFLVTQTQLSATAISVADVLSATTYITGGQTVASITNSYVKILGTTYGRIVMTAAGSATSASGSGNTVAVTATVASSSTYNRALSTARSDFLITDTEYDASGIATSDVLSVATYLTGGQTISSITRNYISISGTSYTRIIMSGVANANSTANAGNDVTVTLTAAGTGSSYAKTNYLYFTSSSWLASGATVGTKLATSVTQFPAGTSVAQTTTRTFGATTVYRVVFTQSANTSIASGASITFQFGAFYALPGEQVFSFIANPGESQVLNLDALKELTATAIGGRGTFPNGPDVLAINVYKVSGTATPVNLILRWGEAQA